MLQAFLSVRESEGDVRGETFPNRTSGGIRAETYGFGLLRNLEMVTQLYFDFWMSFFALTGASFWLKTRCKENEGFLSAHMHSVLSLMG